MLKINGYSVRVDTFPNGETRISGADLKHRCRESLTNVLELKYESDKDLIHMMFIKKHLDAIGARCWLHIHYMPYSRQDRVEDNSMFTLKYIANFINSLSFDDVTVVEPHSDVTMALLDKVTDVYPTVDRLDEIMSYTRKIDSMFYPDAGAAKRYSSKITHPYMVGYKVRDFKNGRISRLDVLGYAGAKRVLILDDLCSYGGTFILAGKALKELGAVDIYLFITHCEKSIFEGNLLKDDGPINTVFCMDTMISAEEADKACLEGRLNRDKIKVIKG